jgi:hypothetical protein
MRDATITALSALKPAAVVRGFDWSDAPYETASTLELIKFLGEVAAYLADEAARG